LLPTALLGTLGHSVFSGPIVHPVFRWLNDSTARDEDDRHGEGGVARVVPVERLDRFSGKQVTVRGWLYGKRHSGKLFFLLVRDGTGVVQAVVSKRNVDAPVFEACHALTQESSLTVTGVVSLDPRAVGGVEIGVTQVQIVHLAEEYPISPKEHGVGFLMDQRHLWVRSSRQHALLRLRAEVVAACQEYLDRNGFVRFDTPILTPCAAEGSTTLFTTRYFDMGPAYLAQTGQLYVEAGMMSFGKVYCFGPTFRAEKSKTRRHLTEFWMLEPEIAFCGLEESLAVQEKFVSYVVGRCLRKRRRELEVLERDVRALENVKPPFPRIRYDDALEMIRAHHSEEPDCEPLRWGEDLGAPHETLVSKRFDRPVFVTHYPLRAKAFYMKADPERSDVALCADLLAPEGYGEIIGGSQREDDAALLEARIREWGLDPADYTWYVDLRRYGSVPHSGFGLGIERFVAWLSGVHHIRETIPFPRTLGRLRP
jgi:asparaginyl-tRNA synthetase